MAKRWPEQDTLEQDAEAPPDGPSGPSVLDWARLVAGAARRRWFIALAVFLVGVSASFVVLQLRRPMYRVESRILAQRQTMLPSAVKPTVQDDSPTRAAWDLVHRRSNLIAIVKAAQLADPGPAGAAASPEAGAADETPFDLMVHRLDRALKVEVEEGTITIGVDWPNPVQAFRIVETTLQNFLEARHVQEITAIDEVISVLRGRLAALRANLEQTTAEVQREFGREADAPRWAAGGRGAPAPPSAPAPALPSEEVVRLKSMLEAKERAIQDVDEFRRRKLEELQAQLEEKRGIFSEAHPTIISLRQEIAARATQSPQVAVLREEERALRQQLQARQAQERPQNAAAAHPVLPPSRISLSTVVDDDVRVRQARSEYQALLGRVSSAEVDLDAARTAFKYRYSVIWPAEVPRKPFSPNPVKIMGLGAFASLLLALFVATILELGRGQVLEVWQVEKSLGLTVLARVERR
jgi:hypothetical protein